VIGMVVRQQDRRGPRIRAKQRLHGLPDQPAAARGPRVDQRPGRTGLNQVDVRAHDPFPNGHALHTRRDLARHTQVATDAGGQAPTIPTNTISADLWARLRSTSPISGPGPWSTAAVTRTCFRTYVPNGSP
jgi:hypothetical protein